MVFPELVLTGYTCGELFIQKSLLAKAKEELRKLIAFTAGDSMLVFVGLPWEYNNKLYNVAAAIQDGKLLGLAEQLTITVAPADACAILGGFKTQTSSQISAPTTRFSTLSQENKSFIPIGT